MAQKMIDVAKICFKSVEPRPRSVSPVMLVQVPAPPRLIESGLPAEALVTHAIVGNYPDHPPLYRHAHSYARQTIELDRSTLADWVRG